MTTVEAIERIRGGLLKPPSIGSFVRGQRVVQATDDAQLGPLLIEMRLNDYSQAPVVGTGSAIGLITTNAIARWMAQQLQDNGFVDANDATVYAAMSMSEPFESIKVMSRRSPFSRTGSTAESRPKRINWPGSDRSRGNRAAYGIPLGCRCPG